MKELENQTINTVEENRKFLLNEQSYGLLSAAQRKIREATEITPHIRKILNAIVTAEAVEKAAQMFIEKYESEDQY